MLESMERGLMGEKKKKFRVRYAVLIVLAVIVAVAAALVVWQWDNIKALRYAASTSDEELEQQMEENQREFDETAKEYGVPDISLTDDEIAALEGGDENLDGVVDRVMSGSDGESETNDSSGTQDAEVQRLITSLYVLRSSYSSRLNGLISEAKSEFMSLAPEKRTDTARRRIVAAKISEASSLESSCDAQVNSLVQSLRSRLSALGQDTSVADQIMSAYQQEKTLRKASYMSQLG